MTQPFHFPNGQAANDAQDLLELCKQYPDDASGYLVRQDLESWLAYIGNSDFAECAANARQIDAEDPQKLAEFLNRCHFLTAPKSVSAAVNETKIEENPITPESTATTTDSTQDKAVTSTPPATTASLLPQTAPKQSVAPLETVTVPKQPVAPLETETVLKQPVAKTSVDSNSANSQEKPSFFHVVAKFIVSILYRNKA